MNMVVGFDQEGENEWTSLDNAIELILYENLSSESVELFDACDVAQC